LACLTPYKVPQIIEGRFLQWTPITYFLDTQQEPIELCPPSLDLCKYYFPDETETYKLPAESGDIIKWIMNKNEITIDGGSSILNLKVGITQQGVLVAGNIGTITEDVNGTQYYCTASIPCLPESCDYQIVIYDDSILPPITCGIYAGATLQNVIDSNIALSQVLECALNDFL
jgi:hypothetical protein